MALTTVAHSRRSVEAHPNRDAMLHDIARYLVIPGRLFFSLLFILFGLRHFTQGTIAYAAQHGLPMAHFLVPVTGLLAVLGGLSVLLGFRARIGALLLIAFLVPVTFFMHNFWAIPDPQQAQEQLVHFMKNIALLGATFLILYFGSGPLSLDEKVS